MRRPWLMLLAMLLAGIAVFLAGRALADYWCNRHAARPTDDLAWLHLEFGLNDAEMARVRKLHEGYLPTCRGFCEQINTRKQELQSLLRNRPANLTGVEEKLTEIGVLRAKCQAAMLRHFYDVSEAMPQAQGQRYLNEMQRLTLGFHERIEGTMATPVSSPHEHH